LLPLKSFWCQGSKTKNTSLSKRGRRKWGGAQTCDTSRKKRGAGATPHRFGGGGGKVGKAK